MAQSIKRSNHWWLAAAPHKVSVQVDCPQKEVRSARSGADPIDLEQVLQGPSVVLVPAVVRYRVSFSSALFNHLQLWHLHWLAEASWNVMAREQKPDFVFRRNGRVHLNQQVASVQSTTGSRGVRISGSNAGHTVFRCSVKSTGYPRHSPVSSSLAITFQLESKIHVRTAFTMAGGVPLNVSRTQCTNRQNTFARLGDLKPKNITCIPTHQ